MKIENKVFKTSFSNIFVDGRISTFVFFGDINIGSVICPQILMPKDPNYSRLCRTLKDWKDEN